MRNIHKTLLAIAAALVAIPLVVTAAGFVDQEVLTPADSERAFEYMFDIPVPTYATVHGCLLIKKQLSHLTTDEIRGCYITVEAKDFQSLFKAWPAVHCVPSSTFHIGVSLPMVGPAFTVTEACYMNNPPFNINEAVVFTDSTRTKLRAYHRNFAVK